MNHTASLSRNRGIVREIQAFPERKKSIFFWTLTIDTVNVLVTRSACISLNVKPFKLRLSNLAIAFKHVDARSEVATDMQTIEVKLSPHNGEPSRTITLRLGAPKLNEIGWGVFVEILGFNEPYGHTIYGEDWAQAIELAAKILPSLLETCVANAGGGTLEPSFFERPPHTPDLSDLPPDVVQALSNSSTSDD